jgi:hypothetical protein
MNIRASKGFAAVDRWYGWKAENDEAWRVKHSSRCRIHSSVPLKLSGGMFLSFLYGITKHPARWLAVGQPYYFRHVSLNDLPCVFVIIEVQFVDINSPISTVHS